MEWRTLGEGVKRVREVALLVSKEVNDKRRAKGLQPRPVRTAVIGQGEEGGSGKGQRVYASTRLRVYASTRLRVYASAHPLMHCHRFNAARVEDTFN